MLKFPSGLYGDVRVEEVWSTAAGIVLGRLEQYISRHYRAAFLRIWDGRRWYYSSTTAVDGIQKALDDLATLARPNPSIADDPVVRRFEVNRGSHLLFEGSHVAGVPRQDKISLLEASCAPLRERAGVPFWQSYYLDSHRRKTFLSSLGADLVHDAQTAGLVAQFEMAHEDSRLTESVFTARESFGELPCLARALEEKLERAGGFVRSAMPVEGGSMPVILSPFAAGIFAHESFGHKSEADFMLGDPAMLSEWSIGRRVGREELSIVDDGQVRGSGFVPFDDEGTRARRTYLVRRGELAGRLHSVETAAALREDPTGNARSVGFEYQPIPRMTTTFIEGGASDFDGLVSRIDRGVYVETVKHGSGLSTFTLAPSMSWMIRGGRLAEPVNVSVVTGSVMETLGRIEGLSGTVELFSMPTGGCGKHEQHPLPVGFGGPAVLVGSMEVR